ncbi:MAG: 16S rRNA (guanine(966)-N(2))-methyltransferase RsmD [Sphingomicrobium sp.]
MLAPPGTLTRPTADRVRETLFSMLASRLGSFKDLRVADLFAGTGALGLEALSRGASFACFVESDAQAAAAIKANAEQLGALDRVQVRGGSALALPIEQPFDLVFADPPYAPGSGTAAASAVGAAQWLAPGGWMAVETASEDSVDPGQWTLDTERKVGRAKLTLLRSALPFSRLS